MMQSDDINMSAIMWSAEGIARDVVQRVGECVCALWPVGSRTGFLHVAYVSNCTTYLRQDSPTRSGSASHASLLPRCTQMTNDTQTYDDVPEAAIAHRGVEEGK